MTRKAKHNLKDLSLSEIEDFISSLGKEKYRARQLMKWIYQSGMDDFAGMTNLSKEFRKELETRAYISMLEIQDVKRSSDGTQKILFRLQDGLYIESVLIPGNRDWTLCVSTQAGCRMGCVFCLTGSGGFKRNLLPSEITDQYTVCRFQVNEGRMIDNIVLMGMGEPLDNYDNVRKAVNILSSDYGPGLSSRKITLSTCGIPPGIRRLGEELAVNLAISLNAVDDEGRGRLMPINKKYGISELLKACRDYPMPKRRRITFEYILIAGENDSPADAEKLARTLRGLRCKINLIAFNEFPGTEFRSPSPEAVERFRQVLVKHNFTAIVRASRGGDIMAACGQLAGNLNPEKG